VLQGADAFLGGTRPRTTVTIDGRAIGFNELIYGLSSLWDVRQVEVFRTPQSTTQGRNSIAGAIFLETEAPTFDLEGRARGVVGNRDYHQLSGVLSGPIVADEIAARVAVDWRQQTAASITPPLLPGLDQRADNFTNARARLLVTPSALPDLRLDIIYNHLETEAPQSDTVRPPFEARRNDVGGGGYYRTNVDAVTGIVRYAITPDVNLRITPSYTRTVADRLAEPGGGDARVATREFTLEGVLDARLSPALDAVVGIYALDARQRERIDLSLFLGVGSFTDHQQSLGLFGEATFRPAPRLSITLGGRYQRDRQDRAGFLGTSDFGFTVDYDRSFDAFLPKAALAYELSDDATIGLLVQRAFNPGGTTISFITGEQDLFDAETLWNYEAYARTVTLNGRLTLGANIFYTDFTNAQRFTTRVVPVPIGGEDVVTDIGNVPAARSYGAEVEGRFAITPQFAVSFGLGLLDTEITRTPDVTDPILGREFQRAPGFTGALGVAWEIVSGVSFDAQLRSNSRYFSDDANTPALAIEGSTMVDTKLTWTTGRFTLFAFARNAFDEFALTQLFAPDFGTPNEARLYGVGIEARF
jgi:outer membrane receptor protein involved in Fe transport